MYLSCEMKQRLGGGQMWWNLRSTLSPPQHLSHHLHFLHYATFPCSFLSDIKRMVWILLNLKPRVDILPPPTWLMAENSQRGGMWKCSLRWGEMMCYTKVFHNKHSHSHQTVSCRAVWASLQCTGAEERGKKRQRVKWWGGGPVVPWTRSAYSPWWRNGNCQLWA